MIDQSKPMLPAEVLDRLAVAERSDRDMIRQSAAEFLACRLLPLSMKALERLLTDPAAPGSAVVGAARLVFEAERMQADLAGVPAEEIHEMTIEEMDAELAALKQAVVRRSAQAADLAERDRSLDAAFE